MWELQKALLPKATHKSAPDNFKSRLLGSDRDSKEVVWEFLSPVMSALKDLTASKIKKVAIQLRAPKLEDHLNSHTRGDIHMSLHHYEETDPRTNAERLLELGDLFKLIQSGHVDDIRSRLPKWFARNRARISRGGQRNLKSFAWHNTEIDDLLPFKAAFTSQTLNALRKQVPAIVEIIETRAKALDRQIKNENVLSMRCNPKCPYLVTAVPSLKWHIELLMKLHKFAEEAIRTNKAVFMHYV